MIVFAIMCSSYVLIYSPCLLYTSVDDLITQGVAPRAAMRMVREEAVQCLAKAL